MKTSNTFALSLVAGAMLTACGGGGDSSTTAAPLASDGTRQVALAARSKPAQADVSVVKLVKVSETRIGRTEFEYVFQIVVSNGGSDPVSDIRATLSAAGTGTTIIDGSVDVGNVAAGASVTPADTITMRHDRAVPFDTSALVWSFAAIPEYRAEIRWTPYAVAHVKAPDYGGLGYGAAYAQVKHRECELFNRLLVTSGRRAFFEGPGANDANINSDLYHQFLRTKVQGWLDGPADSIDTPSQNARELMRGWVAGVNRYLGEIGGPDGISDPRCKGRPDIQPITELDGWMHVATYNGQSQTTNAVGIATAIPPGAPVPTTCTAGAGSSTGGRASRLQASLPVATDDVRESSGDGGSNALAVGRLLMKNGMKSALLTNPHWQWSGSQRYFDIQLTIPGEVDAIGISRDTMPFIIFGHNKDLAWTRTVSTSSRFGWWGLTLEPQNPTRYMYEGAYRDMTTTCVSTDVRQPDGSTAKVERLIYETVWGPVARTAAFPWTAQKAYAFRTAAGDLSGVKVLDEHLAFMKSKDVRDHANILNKYAATTGNQIVVDRYGDIFLGDIGGTPGVTAAQVSGTTGGGCLDPQLGASNWANGVPVFDGSRASCAWQGYPGAPSGLAGFYAPHAYRQDYISQSNQNYWLMNPQIRLAHLRHFSG